MKDVERYMKMSHAITIVEDPYEGGYVVSFPELIGCLTCVDKAEDIIPMAMDAKRCWIEACLDMGLEIPEPCCRKGRAKWEPLCLRVKASLYRSLKKKAIKKGLSLTEYCIFLLEKGV